jgi:amino acid transporter
VWHAASRVIQAVARDNLLPIGWLAVGSGKTDEPRRALAVTGFLTMLCLLIPNFNLISTYASMFLVMAYTFVNLSCLILSVAGTVNFRPDFKYYSWYTALAGTLLCAGVMFLTSYQTALISVAIVLLLLAYIVFVRKPQTNWGDVSQALLYQQVRRFLLHLDTRRVHVKYWRPHVLLMVRSPACKYQLMHACSRLKKARLRPVAPCGF